MFKKLRNKFVLMNFVITSTVLIIAFSTIYFVAYSTTRRRPMPREDMNFTPAQTRIIDEQVHDERRESMASLLVTLIVVGLVVEVAVVIVSYTIAEMAIHPIRESYEAQKIFVANASHEIKTPLAVIAANIEAAELPKNKWTKNINSELQRLTALNQQLLDLAQVDNFEIRGVVKQVDVKKMINEIVTGFAAVVEKKKLDLEIVTTAQTTATTYAEDLRQVLVILIDNAIKYGEKWLKIEYENYKIKITNDGATIADEDLKHIFERFYQVDKTASGVGLGLAIAQTIAQKDNWKLSANSDKKTTTLQLDFRLRAKLLPE